MFLEVGTLLSRLPNSAESANADFETRCAHVTSFDVRSAIARRTHDVQ